MWNKPHGTNSSLERNFFLEFDRLIKSLTLSSPNPFISKLNFSNFRPRKDARKPARKRQVYVGALTHQP